MGISNSIVLLLLIGIFTSSVYSFCLRSQLVSQTTKYGNIDEQCVYNNIKVLPGSSFKLAAPDCLECKCTNQGLQCCGFGFAAGIVVPPEGCIAHNDACNLIFVKKDNSSAICHQPKPINNSKKNKKLLANRRTSMI